MRMPEPVRKTGTDSISPPSNRTSLSSRCCSTCFFGNEFLSPLDTSGRLYMYACTCVVRKREMPTQTNKKMTRHEWSFFSTHSPLGHETILHYHSVLPIRIPLASQREPQHPQSWRRFLRPFPRSSFFQQFIKYPNEGLLRACNAHNATRQICRKRLSVPCVVCSYKIKTTTSCKLSFALKTI